MKGWQRYNDDADKCWYIVLYMLLVLVVVIGSMLGINYVVR